MNGITFVFFLCFQVAVVVMVNTFDKIEAKKKKQQKITKYIDNFLVL